MLTKLLALALVAFSLPALADQKNPLAAFDEMIAKSAETRDNFKLAMSLHDLRKQGLDKKCDEASLEPQEGMRKLLESSSAYKLSLRQQTRQRGKMVDADFRRIGRR